MLDAQLTKGDHLLGSCLEGLLLCLGVDPGLDDLGVHDEEDVPIFVTHLGDEGSELLEIGRPDLEHAVN